MLTDYQTRVTRLAAETIRREYKRRQGAPASYGVSDWTRVYRAEDAIAEVLPATWKISWPAIDDPAPTIQVTRPDGSTFTL